MTYSSHYSEFTIKMLFLVLFVNVSTYVVADDCYCCVWCVVCGVSIAGISIQSNGAFSMFASNSNSTFRYSNVPSVSLSTNIRRNYYYDYIFISTAIRLLAQCDRFDVIMHVIDRWLLRLGLFSSGSIKVDFDLDGRRLGD